MRVAIMGAGLSGLVCAFMLEKHGVQPVIFEKRSRVGDRFVNGEAFFNIYDRPINDCLTFFANKYGIILKPISDIKHGKLFTPTDRTVIKGRLGYTNIRGRHKDSFESQLISQVKSEVVYNSTYTYEDLKKDFTHVVVATGDGAYAHKMGNYTWDLTVALKGATVEGEFDISSVAGWFNNDFAPKGYAWLIPFSQREANIVIGYPDYSANKAKDINVLWDRFYNRVCRDIGQNLRVTDSFEVNNYIIGISKRSKIDNTLFTGNCFGANMPAFGFGQFPSILTGIYAAYDICGIGDYEKMTKPLRNVYKNSFIIRKGMERLDNRGLDNLCRILKNKIAQRTFDSSCDIDILKIASYFIRPIVVAELRSCD